MEIQETWNSQNNWKKNEVGGPTPTLRLITPTHIWTMTSDKGADSSMGERIDSSTNGTRANGHLQGRH